MFYDLDKAIEAFAEKTMPVWKELAKAVDIRKKVLESIILSVKLTGLKYFPILHQSSFLFLLLYKVIFLFYTIF